MFLTPDDKIVAVEVKGTLVAGRIPRLSRREMTQMTAAWVDKPATRPWQSSGSQSADIFGAIAVINFADMTRRIALMADFQAYAPSAGSINWPALTGSRRNTDQSHNPTLAHLRAMRHRRTSKP